MCTCVSFRQCVLARIVGVRGHLFASAGTSNGFTETKGIKAADSGVAPALFSWAVRPSSSAFPSEPRDANVVVMSNLFILGVQ
jgi:hypothetical protein